MSDWATSQKLTFFSEEYIFSCSTAESQFLNH